MDSRPRLVLTGAAGFLGKRLVARLSNSWRIEAIDREPPDSGALVRRRNVRWHRLDLADAPAVERLFAQLRATGGATALLHFAAHYDFSGGEHPEYRRTNVEGTRLLLDACDGLGLERFVFASSLAACAFPPAGERLDETSPPDGDHPYAVSKRAGEAMMRAERRFPTAIVRLAALYSDWCEYAPLYSVLGTWLSKRWNSRFLGGRGLSAVPYLHVRDACLFVDRLLDRRHALDPGEILIASPNRVASHAELFQAATRYAYGTALRPIPTPRPVAALGLRLLDLAGRIGGEPPFERPWMARMIDRRLEVDAHRSQARLGWAPRARLDILRRIPFLIENQFGDPGSWAARNEAALHLDVLPSQVQILRLLEEHSGALLDAFTKAIETDPESFPHYAHVGPIEHEGNLRELLRNLAHSIRSRRRGYFRSFCHDVALRRARQGRDQAELRSALHTFQRVLFEVLAADPRARALEPALHELVSHTIDFGLDGVEAGYEEAVGAERPQPAPAAEPALPRQPPTREDGAGGPRPG
jgi:nucleoside-diphosphate-sugar epimerase